MAQWLFSWILTGAQMAQKRVMGQKCASAPLTPFPLREGVKRGAVRAERLEKMSSFIVQLSD